MEIKCRQDSQESLLLQIPTTGMIKEQSMKIDREVVIIYGYNNSGKTSFLSVLNQVFYHKLMENFLLKREGELSVYIPTNRLVLSKAQTEDVKLKDLEEFIYYQRDAQDDYNLHLKRIRDSLMANEVICRAVARAVREIFNIEIVRTEGRYSDGIENVINIYLNIIWAMLWDRDLENLTEKEFKELTREKRIYVLIDEIEMFLHVNIQAKLIGSLRKSFQNCCFILTTHSPLLLTRYRQMAVYNIEDGMLYPVECELYYKDLDMVYDELFFVEELPEQIREDINYLGDVIMNRTGDPKKINALAKRLKEEYSNLFRKYNKIIVKASYIGEESGIIEKNERASGAVPNGSGVSGRHIGNEYERGI